MHPEVALISKTVVEWKTFFAGAAEVLGRAVSTPLDAKNIEAERLDHWIACLDELFYAAGKLPDSLRNAGRLLEHCSLGFLVLADSEIFVEIVESSPVVASSVFAGHRSYGDRLAVMTGTLAAWRETLINLATGKESMGARVFADKVFLILTNEGLGEVFWDCRTEALPDHTFKLLPKR